MIRRNCLQPPRLLRGLLRAVLSNDRFEIADGDLTELFAARLAERGARYARWRYRRDAVSVFIDALRSSARDGARVSAASGQVRPMLRELRYGCRTLLRRPGFSTLAVLTLGAGIAAATTVLSATTALLVRPAASFDRDVVMIWGTNTAIGQRRDVVAGPTFLDLQRESGSLSGLAAFHFGDLTLRHGEGVGVVSTLEVTPEFFSVIGAAPASGRTFVPDDTRGSADVVMVSHGFWQRELGGDPAAIGRTLVSSGRRLQVIGILDPEFRFFDTPDVVTLLRPELLASEARTHYYYWIVGRLRAGVDARAAERDLDGVMSRVAAMHSSVRGWDVTVEPLSAVLAEPVGPAARLALAAGGLMLLIACANVASLILVHHVRRQRELGIRLSLGASRLRVFCELMAETACLAAAGAIAGLALSTAAVGALGTLLPPAVAIAGSAATVAVPALTIDWTAFATAAIVSLAAALASGLVPAWHASRAAAPGVVPAPRGATSSRRARRLANGLVSIESGIAMVLVVLAVLLVRTVAALGEIDPGFRGDRVMAMTIGRIDELSADARAGYYTEVLRRVGEMPGVSAVALNDYVLLTNEDDYEGFEIEGRAPLASGGWPREEWRRVSADYFRTMSIPILGGRGLTVFDNDRSASAVVINEAMARKYWPGQHPVGRRIRITARAYGWSEIVGIAGDVREVGVDRPAKPMMFVPYHRDPRPVMALFANVDGDLDRMTQAIQVAVRSVDPTRPVYGVRRVDRLIADSMAIRRLAERVTTAVAVLALLLTAIGVYGTLNQSVQQRRREMGVRVAIGARRRDVIALIVRQGAGAVAAGLLLGSIVAAWTATLARQQLFGVSASDPWVYALSAAILMSAALAASVIPALGAARVDPIVALGEE